MILNATGRQIRAGRVMANLTQGELAKRAGISRATLANIESGESEPRLATYRSLLMVLEAAGVRITANGIERVPGRRPAPA
jgi:DNA-binding XRE family transcriptional regulator